MAKKGTKSAVTPRDQSKYDFAYLLFMQRVPQQDICERVGVSAPTLQSWKESGTWEAKRASRNISLDDLLQNAMVRINIMLEDPKFNADSFAKAVSQLKTLKGGKNTIDDDINALTSFSEFIVANRQENDLITDDFIKALTRLQDSYIQSRLK